ncbi:hypothetical protein L9F63_009105 [Diploptera punctata]|uniref:Uncharacterized protein n=1 Tax=Diploptera punctata TaxID=6984 RepID=A0AAD7Z4B3_DIPPU|nr:hypothetical protein L9F63_009105 [Diploptera punctata]
MSSAVEEETSGNAANRLKCYAILHYKTSIRHSTMYLKIALFVLNALQVTYCEESQFPEQRILNLVEETSSELSNLLISVGDRIKNFTDSTGQVHQGLEDQKIILQDELESSVPELINTTVDTSSCLTYAIYNISAVIYSLESALYTFILGENENFTQLTKSIENIANEQMDIASNVTNSNENCIYSNESEGVQECFDKVLKNLEDEEECIRANINGQKLDADHAFNNANEKLAILKENNEIYIEDQMNDIREELTKCI